MYEGDMEKKPKKKFTDVQRWKYLTKKNHQRILKRVWRNSYKKQELNTEEEDY